MTHYEVLGVARTASGEELRRAYVALARRHHPDIHAEGQPRRRAERRMQEINEAWAVLSDVELRRRYDRTLAPFDPPPTAPHAPGATRPDGDDDIDWDRERDLDLLDETPLSDAHVKGSWTVLPVGLFFTSVALFCLAMVLQAAPLLALSGVVFLISGLTFLIMPFVAMAGSRRNDLSDGRRP